MTNLADPAIARIRAWHDQQNPLVRALTEPLVVEVSEVLTQMQAVNDTLANAQLAVNDALAAAQLAAEAAQAEQKIAAQVTKDRIDQLERFVFGQKAERRPKTPDARKDARKQHRDTLSDAEKKSRRDAAAQIRQDKLDALRTEVLVLPLGAGVPEGRPLPPLESVIYEWRPGELVRIVVRREQRVLPDGKIVTAPPPPQVIEGGQYGPALHAKVAMDKCLNVMPLRRQERAFERLGAPLPISVLCALFHRSADCVAPLYKAMIADVGSAEHVSADETPQPVLDEDKVRTGWMWVFATDDTILFVYSPSRGGKVPESVLGKSKGTLTVDGHTGYNLVTGDDRRARGGCWSHARRYLFEARSYAEVMVDGLLGQIGELFYVEQLAIEEKIVGTDAHLALRTARSAPLVARIMATAENHVDLFDARSSLAKALRYVLNQREALSLFLTDARVPIHNNLSERALRIVALLRKNALFVGNDESGENLAMLLSMAATCQLHGVNPEAWLADVLIRVGEPGNTVEDLLPAGWKERHGQDPRPGIITG